MQYNNFRIDDNKKLGQEFFLQPTEQVAESLLGAVFSKQETNGEIIAGRIVETEAYLHKIDAASHSYCGPTPRNAPMFEQGGIIYVYKIYGIHHCLNFVTETKGIGAAVLIRAMEPLSGIETMQKRRNTRIMTNLLSGPGKICQAFGIGIESNYMKLFSDSFVSISKDRLTKDTIARTERIGISRAKDMKLRIIIENSAYLSRKISKK
jgi:DNA-3-methyladenine glycosylase